MTASAVETFSRHLLWTQCFDSRALMKQIPSSSPDITAPNASSIPFQSGTPRCGGDPLQNIKVLPSNRWFQWSPHSSLRDCAIVIFVFWSLRTSVNAPIRVNSYPSLIASTALRLGVLSLYPRIHFIRCPAFPDLFESCYLCTDDQESIAPAELLRSVNVKVWNLG